MVQTPRTYPHQLKVDEISAWSFPPHVTRGPPHAECSLFATRWWAPHLTIVRKIFCQMNDQISDYDRPTTWRFVPIGVRSILFKITSSSAVAGATSPLDARLDINYSAHSSNLQPTTTTSSADCSIIILPYLRGDGTWSSHVFPQAIAVRWASATFTVRARA